jgi:NAD(P)-dependent dehydrogenase (short-subunit alcohol dehydrogenase family)
MSAGFDVAGVAGALARIGEPEEVSNLVVYLASDESSSRPDLSSLSMEDNWRQLARSTRSASRRNRGWRNDSRA